MWTSRRKRRRGGALLAVLWLSAALAAIAFSLANTVRGETERAATAVDGARAYYLAVGGVERTMLRMLWARQQPGLPQQFRPTGAALDVLQFPEGEVRVAIVPETAKMNVNGIRPEEMFRLLGNLGVPPEQARTITMGLVAWRQPAGQAAAADPFASSFRPSGASIQEIEELLALPGMTPEIYYGTYQRLPDGTLAPQGGLMDCLSVFGAGDRFDANGAHPAVLLSAGVPPDVVGALLQRRRMAPFATEGELARFLGGNPGRLRVGGNSMFTLRATARPRLADGKLSDVRRTAGAMVKFMPPGYDAPYHILRWYDTLWSQSLEPLP